MHRHKAIIQWLFGNNREGVIVERHALLTQNVPELSDKPRNVSVMTFSVYRKANPGPHLYQQYWPLFHDFGLHVIKMHRFHDARLRI
jgi:hypothetical protein